MDGGHRNGKRPLVKPRNRWKYTAKMDLKEGCNDIDLIHLAQDTVHRRLLVTTTTNRWFP
jgi:hypothetical protein